MTPLENTAQWWTRRRDAAVQFVHNGQTLGQTLDADDTRILLDLLANAEPPGCRTRMPRRG
jgi:hypothetical protein